MAATAGYLCGVYFLAFYQFQAYGFGGRSGGMYYAVVAVVMSAGVLTGRQIQPRETA
jgi:hypothetical protein